MLDHVQHAREQAVGKRVVYQGKGDLQEVGVARVLGAVGLPGAEAPKRSMAMRAPCWPVQRSHPSGAPASTASRAVAPAGSTLSRYAAVCASNRRHDGIETRRTRTPDRCIMGAAAAMRPTSEPLAIKMTSGLCASTALLST